MRLVVGGVITLLLGCPTRPSSEYCDEAQPCDTGVCDLAHNTCVGSIDGATGDAAGVDGAGVDAQVGAPIVDTYELADLVVGQPNFDTGADAGCVQVSAAAASVAVDGGVLYVLETMHNRALAWAPVPTTNNPTPVRVLGKPAFTNCNMPSGISASDFSPFPAGHIASSGGLVAVADRGRNRVLVWGPPPAGNGESADLVLGQTSFTTSIPGNAAGQMKCPTDLWTDGTRVVVADSCNNRVLIWSSFPTANGQGANVVLGQTGFGIDTTPTAPSASNLKAPTAVWSDGTRLVVSDSGFNRVLVWTSFPTTSGEAADLVVGQSSFTNGSSGLSAARLNQPAGIAANADALFVADAGNDRILVFQPFPAASTPFAAYVLGQPDLSTGGNSPAPTQQSLDDPQQIRLIGNQAWVADTGHRRVLRFPLYP